jgi:hypothetical protein
LRATPELRWTQFATVTIVPPHRGTLADDTGRNVVKGGNAALGHPTPDAVWANTPIGPTLDD